MKAVLEAEKGKFAWREERARTGYKELNALNPNAAFASDFSRWVAG